MSSKTESTDIRADAIKMISGGALFGACVSQILYNGVHYLPVSLGAVGGAIWYVTKPGHPGNRTVGKFYSSR